MGDTFVDYLFEPPQEWNGYELVDTCNTKWDGNRYTYEYLDPDSGFMCRIHLWSKSPSKIWLDSGVELDDGNGLYVSVALSTPRWDSIDAAMAASDAQLKRIMEICKTVGGLL